MAFKLTYRDGEADDYDDGTAWAVEGGVLEMGRESGKWTVLVSPSHWATIEVRDDEDKGAKGKAEDKDRDEDEDQDEDDEGDDEDEDDEDDDKDEDDEDDDKDG